MGISQWVERVQDAAAVWLPLADVWGDVNQEVIQMLEEIEDKKRANIVQLRRRSSVASSSGERVAGWESAVASEVQAMDDLRRRTLEDEEISARKELSANAAEHRRFLRMWGAGRRRITDAEEDVRPAPCDEIRDYNLHRLYAGERDTRQHIARLEAISIRITSVLRSEAGARLRLCAVEGRRREGHFALSHPTRPRLPLYSPSPPRPDYQYPGRPARFAIPVSPSQPLPSHPMDPFTPGTSQPGSVQCTPEPMTSAVATRPMSATIQRQPHPPRPPTAETSSGVSDTPPRPNHRTAAVGSGLAAARSGGVPGHPSVAARPTSASTVVNRALPTAPRPMSAATQRPLSYVSQPNAPEPHPPPVPRRLW